MGLDQDEAEVLAVIELLWYVGPRMYLNFLDEANKRRIRNAWDRFDRKRKKSEWATLFRQGLRVFARETRRAWRHEYWAHYDRSVEGQDWEHLIPPPVSSPVKSIRRDQPQILHPPALAVPSITAFALAVASAARLAAVGRTPSAVRCAPTQVISTGW